MMHCVVCVLQDEVLAISEKVVLRADDLLGWITDEVRWPRGLPAVWERECPGPALAEAPHLVSSLLVDSALDLQDVLKEKSLLGEPDPEESGVVVLSFARYCRFRGIMKRLEGVSNKWLHNALVLALGGFAAPCRNTRVLFCKDTFDYPDLEGHEQLCNHLAPNLKGRPRKRPKKRSLSPGGSESNESESSLSTVSSSLRSKQQIPGRNGLRCNSIAQQNSPARGKKVEREVGPDEKEFLVKLHSFMKSRRTPISRVPHLGFKEIDLYAFFTKVQKLGGYNSVTANRLWKTIYDELGGHQGSTSAATYTRRHYERLLLPYEKSTRGEQKDGVRNHTKLKSVKSEDKSDEEKDDVDSPTETSSEKGAENESSKEKSSGESKTAALRSIRPKMEKVEENIPSDKENIPVSNSLPQVNSPSSIANASANGNSTSGLVNGSLTKTSGTTNCITNGEASSTPTAEISAENDDPKVVPEVIDLASEESQVKIGKSPVPAFKKRKLEILKEGGLEVTAISSLGSETSVTPVVEKRPSVIQHAAPVTAPPSDNNQVSITVTPDVGHILGSPRGEVATTPSPISPFDTSTNHSNIINVQDLKHKMHNQNLPQDAPAGAWSRRFPPKVVQSRSIYTHSESTVYGNPKDIFDPRQLLYSERVPGRMVPHTEEEVLDLRVKSPQKSTLSVNRVHPIAAASVDSPRNLSKTVNKTNNSAFPLLAGRAIVGSNLEITVVDVPKASTNQVKVNPPLPQKPHQPPSRKTTNKTSHRLPPRNENGKFMSMNSQSQSATLHRSTSNSSGGTSLIIPNPYLSSACGRSTPSARTRVSQSQSTVPTSSPSGMIPSFLPGSTSLFPGFLPPVSAANNGGKNSNPFLALSDPLYYSSLYTSHGLYPPSLTPGFVSPLVTPPLFPPSAEQIQLYKELMSQHHTNVRLAQGAANFLGLPRDGSTSITPVGPSTNPSSK
ncbi:hypothetical protein R5R35_008067 [Gryllus longicercus]|uniref:ARID domain-containing protein n=1 Tax=Gryllus longicercus TaxID=2509291 RepID=A0AAN9YZF1_9ORTH